MCSLKKTRGSVLCVHRSAFPSIKSVERAGMLFMCRYIKAVSTFSPQMRPKELSMKLLLTMMIVLIMILIPLGLAEGVDPDQTFSEENRLIQGDYIDEDGQRILGPMGLFAARDDLR